jgi:hypothetical protein
LSLRAIWRFIGGEISDQSIASGGTTTFGFNLIHALRRKLHVDCPLCHAAHAINFVLFVLLVSFAFWPIIESPSLAWILK